MTTSDVEHVLQEAGLAHRAPTQEGSATFWQTECPNQESHTDGLRTGAWVALAADGNVTAGCHHRHCRSVSWASFRVAAGLPAHTEAPPWIALPGTPAEPARDGGTAKYSEDGLPVFDAPMGAVPPWVALPDPQPDPVPQGDPLGWDAEGIFNPETPLSDVPVLGLAVGTLGLYDGALVVAVATDRGSGAYTALVRPEVWPDGEAAGEATRALRIMRVTPERIEAEGRAWGEIQPNLATYLAERVTVSHPAHFHRGALATHAWPVPPRPCICTATAARFLGLPGRLADLAAALELDGAGRTNGADPTTPLRCRWAMVPMLARERCHDLGGPGRSDGPLYGQPAEPVDSGCGVGLR